MSFCFSANEDKEGCFSKIIKSTILIFLLCFCSNAFIKEKKASIVVDFGHGKVLHSRSADAKRHPASLTKMMTLYVLFDELKSGKVNLNTKFKVSKLAAAQSPSKMGFKVGAKVSVLDLIRALAIKSANDAAVVVAEGVSGNVPKFVQRMNNKASALGMKNTHFENPSGLPNKKQVSTARDMATLLSSICKKFPQYFKYLGEKSFSYGGKKIPTHCKILNWYKGADVAKTGFTCASGYNLAFSTIKFNKAGESKRLVVVVFGGDSAKNRDLFSASLCDKHMGGFSICKTSGSAQSKPKQKPSTTTSTPEEAFNIEEILSYSAIDKSFIDELYKHDDEYEAVCIEEEIVFKSKKEKIRKLKTSKNK